MPRFLQPPLIARRVHDICSTAAGKHGFAENRDRAHQRGSAAAATSHFRAFFISSALMEISWGFLADAGA
jgi:hypothetical protein